MGFTQKTWKDRVVEFAGRRILTNVTTAEKTIVDVTRNEGTVSQNGDAFSAENMNDLEKRIAAGFGVELITTLATGTTAVSFTNDAITSTSTIDVYTDVFGVNPIAMSVSGTTLTITFDKQNADMSVKVRVN